MINVDQLQNEILSISHHVGDIKKALKNHEYDYAMEGLKDIDECVDRLKEFIPKQMGDELERMDESIIRRLSDYID